MAQHSTIEWTDHFWSPWTGCTKVSAACDHCYAEAWAKRAGHPELWTGDRRRTSPTYWRQPLKWEREAVASGIRQRVFPSLCDPFDNQVPDEWREDFWRLIAETPHLDWQLVTKRPQNYRKMIPGIGGAFYRPWPNVWLLTTAENQEEADRRIPFLLDMPAAKRGVSLEPLLGPIRLEEFFDDYSAGMTPNDRVRMIEAGETYLDAPRNGLDWVIVGGESCKDARPMHPKWARDLRDQCQAAGVPFFFKQWGEWAPDAEGYRCVAVDGRNMANLEPRGLNGDGTTRISRVGKKAAGRLLDGREWSEFPA